MLPAKLLSTNNQCSLALLLDHSTSRCLHLWADNYHRKAFSSLSLGLYQVLGLEIFWKFYSMKFCYHVGRGYFSILAYCLGNGFFAWKDSKSTYCTASSTAVPPSPFLNVLSASCIEAQICVSLAFCAANHPIHSTTVCQVLLIFAWPATAAARSHRPTVEGSCLRAWQYAHVIETSINQAKRKIQPNML